MSKLVNKREEQYVMIMDVSLLIADAHVDVILIHRIAGLAILGSRVLMHFDPLNHKHAFYHVLYV